MKRLRKESAVSFLTLCMMLILFPTGAFAEELGSSGSLEPVTYIERSWNGSEVVETTKTVTDYIEVSSGTTGFDNGKIYVVKGNVTVSDRISCGSHSRLILTDGCTLNAEKGIGVNGGVLLQIYGQEKNSGKLNANKSGGDENHAGIGGNHYSVRSTIKIHGGTIYAYPTDKSWAPAIGGGTYGRGYELLVYGGYLRASGSYGAAIGKGHSDSVLYGTGTTSISIYGGTVEAQNGGDDAVIEATDLTIAGGALNILTTWEGPAIRSDNTVISGGTLIAASNAAGEVFAGPVNVSGGTTFAIARGSGAVLTKPLNITGGDFSALADVNGTVCKDKLPLTFTDNVWVGYGKTVGEVSGTLKAGTAEIPLNMKYLKATPAALSSTASGDAGISASIISEGSMSIIIGCTALILGAALGFLACKKISDRKRSPECDENE